ncbi:MAG: RNA polymerase sigma factor [Myxococcales bacterium]|nr:RNA polymerase sigma factor [Myxococcales bacterium]
MTVTEAVSRARGGDRAAFDVLVGPELPKLRALLRRMLASPDHVDDVLQDALVKAWGAIEGFRGDAAVGTWLHAIAARAALDFLRTKKRYRAGALLFAQDACVTDGGMVDVLAAVAQPDFHFDVREHVRYCFACVGRSLEPEEQAALVLRDVYEYSNEEAAKSLGLDLGTLRHRLASARETMMRRYDRLCSLVSKEGVCYQCEGLRQAAPADRQGDEPRGALPGAASTRDERWKRRLEVLRDPRADGERTRAMHDVLARQLDALESTRPDADDVEDIPTPGSNCAPTGEA